MSAPMRSGIASHSLLYPKADPYPALTYVYGESPKYLLNWKLNKLLKKWMSGKECDVWIKLLRCVSSLTIMNTEINYYGKEYVTRRKIRL